MKLTDIINPETASLAEAQAVQDTAHALHLLAIHALGAAMCGKGGYKAAFDTLADALRDLDTDSRYLVEDILEEMDKEDEGGII